MSDTITKNVSVIDRDLSESTEEAVQYVVFCMENEEYALPVDYVQEIIIKQDITRIPRTLFYVAGMINLRGHIVPVVNSKKLFSIKSSSASDMEEQIMLLNVGKETVGLIVDRVNDVIYINTDQIEPPPANANVKTDYIQGIGKYEKRLIVLLNLESFYKDV
jgi:purine-binding chemotaxis protein CheW